MSSIIEHAVPTSKCAATQTNWTKQRIQCWPDDITPPRSAPSSRMQDKKQAATQTQWSMLEVPWPISPGKGAPHTRSQAAQTPWSQACIHPWDSTPRKNPNPKAATQTYSEIKTDTHWASIPTWPDGQPISDVLAARMTGWAQGPHDQTTRSPTKRRGGLEIYLEIQAAKQYTP